MDNKTLRKVFKNTMGGKKIKTQKTSYTLKDGTRVTKVYKYDKENAWNVEIFKVSKNGKVTEIVDSKSGISRFDKMLESVDKSNLSKAEKVTLKNDLRAERLKILSGDGIYFNALTRNSRAANRIDIRSMMSRLSETRLDKLAANMGYTPQEIAQQLGISLPELLAADWHSADYVTLADGRTFRFDYGYDGNNFTEV